MVNAWDVGAIPVLADDGDPVALFLPGGGDVLDVDVGAGALEQVTMKHHQVF